MHWEDTYNMEWSYEYLKIGMSSMHCGAMTFAH